MYIVALAASTNRSAYHPLHVCAYGAALRQRTWPPTPSALYEGSGRVFMRAAAADAAVDVTVAALGGGGDDTMAD